MRRNTVDRCTATTVSNLSKVSAFHHNPGVLDGASKDAGSAMYAVEELEEVVDLDPRPFIDEGSSTQQLLDDLLGRFEDDDSPMLPAHGLRIDSFAGSAE